MTISNDDLEALMADTTAPDIIRGAARGALTSPDVAYASRARARCAAYVNDIQRAIYWQEMVANKQAGGPDYTVKVDALLGHAKDFTCADFLDLAFAALDQFGLSEAAQKEISAIITRES